MPPRNTAWTQEEDDKLRSLVAHHGCKKWTRIASNLPSKVGKQCRRRWQNFLNANLKTGVWTVEEDRILLEGHKLHGNKWTEIARMVTGRTDNAVKNRYMALIKKGSPELSDQETSQGQAGSQSNTPRHPPAVIVHSSHSFPPSPKGPLRPEPVRLPPNNSCRGAMSAENSPRLFIDTGKRSGESSTENSQDERKPDLGARTPDIQPICIHNNNNNNKDNNMEVSTSSHDGLGMKRYESSSRNNLKRPEHIGLSIPSPTSTCPSMFREVSQFKSMQQSIHHHPVDGQIDTSSDASRPRSPVVANDDLRRQFEDLLVQASCIDGGSAFIASTIATAQIALFSCRGAGPLAGMYLGSLAAMTRMSNLGMFTSPAMSPAGVPLAQPGVPAQAQPPL